MRRTPKKPGAVVDKSVKVRPQVSLCEWHVYKPAAVAVMSDLGNGKTRPDFKAYIVVRRKYGHYVRQVIPTVFCLCGCGLCAFAVEPSQFADRASVVLTLLLTMVGFQSLVDDLLPKVSYSTWLERYMQTNFYFLMFIFLENALVAWDYVEWLDAVLKWVFVVVFGVMQYGAYISVRRYISEVAGRGEPVVSRFLGRNRSIWGTFFWWGTYTQVSDEERWGRLGPELNPGTATEHVVDAQDARLRTMF